MTELEKTNQVSVRHVEAIMKGNLKGLTTDEKVSYYRSVCESMGLNPLTKPLQYMELNGKEILYAGKECCEQLRHIHKISIHIVSREMIDDMYVVTARAKNLSDGREDESTAAIYLGTLKGDAKANTMMKCETKAKRRVTLSICGLGMMDALEVEDIDHRAVNHIPFPEEPPLQLQESPNASPMNESEILTLKALMKTYTDKYQVCRTTYKNSLTNFYNKLLQENPENIEESVKRFFAETFVKPENAN